MAGQLIRRGERRWLVRVYRGADASTGKRRYQAKVVHGSKRDAQRLLTKMLRARDTNTLVEPSRQTLAVYLDKWLRVSAKPRVRPRTLRDYQSLLERYVIPEIGWIRLDQLSPPSIQRVYNEMLERGLSALTVRYTHAVVRSALAQAVKWQKLIRNPADLVDLPRKPRREMRALSPEQASAFLRAACGTPFEALWVLLLTTGMRSSEAVGLKWSDLDDNKVRVQRVLVRESGGWRFEEPKKALSRRTIVLPPTAVRVLRAHRKRQVVRGSPTDVTCENSNLVFVTRTGQPLDYRTVVRRHFKPLLEKAGLPNIRLYDLRHTCATLLLSRGEHPKIVGERLGHSSTTLTLDTYSHVLPDMQEQAAVRLEETLFS